MVDSRAKGARGEYGARDLLRDTTGLSWERVPMSGALVYLKGDLYIPNEDNVFCIEVKNYAESHFNDKIFTNKSNMFLRWWSKVEQQAGDMNKEPLLFFKYNRSKLFVVTKVQPIQTEYMHVSWLGCYVCLAEAWLKLEQIEFINVKSI